MEKLPLSDLNTENYTQIFYTDSIKYGAPSQFEVHNMKGKVVSKIDLQYGPILETGVNGASNEDLLNIVLMRLRRFQEGKFACRENDIAILKLEEALLWLHHRTNRRKLSGIEGTSKI